MVEIIPQLLSAFIGPVVSILSALTALITVSQARRQSREDAAFRKTQHELQGRQAAAAEQNNDEIRGLTAQLAESNDPAKRQQLEALVEERLGRSPSVTPETLRVQLASTRAALRAEMRELGKRLDGRIDAFVAYPDLVQHETMLHQTFQNTAALMQSAEALKEQIAYQQSQGVSLNVAQLQRELLLRIGQDLMQLAEQVAPPTIRRASLTEPSAPSPEGGA